MAKYEYYDVDHTGFCVSAYDFTGDTTRFIQVVLDGRAKFSGSIDTWMDYYGGELCFYNLEPDTRYKVEFYVGTSTIYSQNSLMRTLYVTTDSPPLNEAFSLYDYEIILNSYDRSTGYADITVVCYYENPNSIEAYGHAICGIVGYKPYSTRDDMWVDAYDVFSVSRRYTNFYVGTLPITLEIYSYGFCYQENGATSGNMAVETRTPDYELEITRPSKFYWRSSSSSLQSGQEINRYITASKWNSLQSNINGVRLYRGLDGYSFTTVYSGDRIKATLYNEIAEAINEMKSGTIATVNKRDPITASCMMALQNGINGIT